MVQVGFIVSLCRPDSTLLAELKILYRQTLDDEVPVQTARGLPVRQRPAAQRRRYGEPADDQPVHLWNELRQ